VLTSRLAYHLQQITKGMLKFGQFQFSRLTQPPLPFPLPPSLSLSLSLSLASTSNLLDERCRNSASALGKTSNKLIDYLRYAGAGIEIELKHGSAEFEDTRGDTLHVYSSRKKREIGDFSVASPIESIGIGVLEML